MPVSNFACGISAGGKISSPNADVRVNATNGNFGIGLVAGKTEFKNESVHVTASKGMYFISSSYLFNKVIPFS